MKKPSTRKQSGVSATVDYSGLVGKISELLETARHASARAVNAVMTATYWEVGRRIIEFEQRGEKRAEYGKALLENLSLDLTSRFGRGFARPNLIRFRQFYLAFPAVSIRSTPSNVSNSSSGRDKQTSDELLRYSTDNLPNKVLVRDYLTALPDESTLAAEIASARRKLGARRS